MDRLIDGILKKSNPTVAGLDTLLEYVPERIRRECADLNGDGAAKAAAAVFRFNREIIDHIADVVPAVKLQLAYYELYGHQGIRCFDETARYARQKGLIVIADGKRNDIGATASAYADAYLGETALHGGTAEAVFQVDALTVNPYLGVDGIEPFLANCRAYRKGVFILVKTSNPSSGQLQDLELANGRKLYEEVAGLVEDWGEGLTGIHGYSSVGAVVGATYPDQARELRKIMRRAFFLVPGFGAQGGSAEDAAAAFDGRGLGAVVNASRSILRAWAHTRWDNRFSHEAFGEAARAEALRMKEALWKAGVRV